MKRSVGTEDTKEGKRKSKKGKGPTALEGVSPADIEKHQKQLMVELRKKTVNKEAVEKLQLLSFESRTEDIASTFQGSDVVKRVCEKYQFLQLEQQVMFVEGMYFQGFKRPYISYIFSVLLYFLYFLSPLYFPILFTNAL